MRTDYSSLGPSKVPPQIEPSLKVGIVPTPDFTLFSLSCFVEFLRLSSDESDFSRQIYCSWELLSHDDKPIRSSCGFPLVPTKSYGDPTAYDYIVVHGGVLHGNTPIPVELYRFVEAAVKVGVPIVGLCTGQFVLAEMGLLAGRRCAVHFSLSSALAQSFPDVIPVTDASVVTDGEFITCPGGLASVNLAMHLVTENCGKSRAHKAMHYLMAGRGFDDMVAMKQDTELGLQCSDQRVVNAVGIMRQRLFETGSVSDVCKGVGVTERELTRLFQKHLRTSPADYWRQMRIKSAHWMVLNSSRSMTQIAYECGFTDSSHMTHWFKRTFNTTPAQLRRVNTQLGIH
ncbi:GlxA family transcriptional regulator [Pseudomonas sp. BF-RE-26]|uniref:GlxA family transcriptional regulator n=1 Tax=Pseudomonas sp. BF-RE-26 TaxID=2832396 RepID=UPI001CBB5E60|nr:helix-turn-helix domain-containing protein [Pseudomonas sp. BF-RE-26]